jgi:hypothetical protein
MGSLILIFILKCYPVLPTTIGSQTTRVPNGTFQPKPRA